MINYRNYSGMTYPLKLDFGFILISSCL